MPDVLRIKRRAVGGAAGPPASLAAAEVAMNEQDNVLYYGKGNSSGVATSIISLAGPGAFLPLDGGIANTLSVVQLGAVGGAAPDTSLDLNFLSSNNLDPRITFSRASTGTYFDATGTLRTAAINAPRWDYAPATRQLNGVLIEEARTNLVPNSTDLTTWGTSPAGCLLPTANVATSPDGTSNASSVVTNDTVNSGHIIFRTFTGAVSTTYVGSTFVKAGAYPRVSLYFGNSAFPAGNTGGLFDLTTGVVVSTSGTTIAAIAPVGNGWYRVSVTAVSLSTSGNYVLSIAPAPAAVTLVGQTYVPASIGLGIFVWGAQVEASPTGTGTVYATSYIPTSGASVTRARDICTTPVGGWYNTSTGTLGVEYIYIGCTSSFNAPVALVGSNVNTDYINVDQQTNPTAGVANVNGIPVMGATGGTGTSASLAPVIPLLPGVVVRCAGAWNLGAPCSGAHNGALTNANTGNLVSANLPTVVNLGVGGTMHSQTQQNLWIRRVRYWPRALSAAELQQVTAVSSSIVNVAIDQSPIGATTPSTGNFTTLAASSAVSGAGFTALLTPYAPLASPVFTGTPSLPTGTVAVTQTAGTSNTSVATTAFVAAAITAQIGATQWDVGMMTSEKSEQAPPPNPLDDIRTTLADLLARVAAMEARNER